MNREGRKQGNLTVLGEYKRENKTIYWKCLCSCGNTTWVKISNFRKRSSGDKTKYMVESCGCLLTTFNKKTHTRHGLADNQFYKAYYSAKGRCQLNKNASYKRYGGLGVKFLFTSFNEFKKTMYKSYLEHVEKYGKKNTSLDRIDCYGDYKPDNCRWATWSQQNLNKRKINGSFSMVLQYTVGKIAAKKE